MAREIVNLGTGANDGTGDPLRTAFEKINNNFSELYSETAADSQISFSGNKISANASNADLVLEASGTGAVQLGALKVVGTTINSDDSTQVTIAENLHVTGNITGTFTGDGSSLTGITATALSTPATVDNLILNDNIISSASNADINITPGGTGSVNIMALTVDGTEISSSDSTQVTIKENLNVTGDVTATAYYGDGSNLTGISADSIGDLSVTGSTISAPSNADLTLNAGGTGSVDIEGIQIKGTEISSTDSSQVTIKENLHVTGNITGTITGTVSTIDADSTTVSNLEVDNFKAATIVLESEGIGSNDNDTTIPTSAAVKAYADSVGGASAIGDITFTGSTISSPSNADITLTPGGTGAVDMGAIRIRDNHIEGTRSNDDINITPNGTGHVNLGKFTIDGPNTTIQSTDNTQGISIGYLSGNPQVAVHLGGRRIAIGENTGSSSADDTIAIGNEAGNSGQDEASVAIGDQAGKTNQGRTAVAIGFAAGMTGQGDDAIAIGDNAGASNQHARSIVLNASNTVLNTNGEDRTFIKPIRSGDRTGSLLTYDSSTGEVAHYTDRVITIVGDDSTGTGVRLNETFRFAGTQNVTTAVSGDVLTITGPDLSSYLTDITLNVVADDSATIALNNNGTLLFNGEQNITTSTDSSGVVTITGPDLSSYITASSSDTLTNKTIDANGTGNSISNIEVADFAAASIVTAGEGIGSNNNDTTIPTSAAVKAYADSVGGAAAIGDITFTGSTISTPSNADLTLNPGGTGQVVLNQIKSEDSSAIQINDSVNVSGGMTVAGGDLVTADISSSGNIDAVGFTSTGNSTFDGVQISDNTITSASSNADLIINASGTGTIVLENLKVGTGATVTTILDEDNMASNSDTALATQQSIKAYVDAQNTAQALTFVGDDSSGTAVNTGETFKFAGATGVTTAVSGDTLTITGPDLSTYITASSSTTFTNKTFDANGTGNSISNIETADIAAATLVTAAEGIGSNNNDTTLPTSAAVKAYADSVGGGSTGDLTISGSTISAPSNADLTLNAGGTGSVDIEGIQIKGTEISSSDSTQVTIKENLHVTGTISGTVDASGLSGTLPAISGSNLTGVAKFAFRTVQIGGGNSLVADDAVDTLTIHPGNNVTITDDDSLDSFTINVNGMGDLTFVGSTIISPSNADITLDPAGTGGIVAQGPVTFNAGYIEKINTLTSSSTITVDCSAASIHKVTLATNTEFNISNLPTGGTVTLIITQDGSGSRTATFGTDGSTAVKFPGGAPTLSTGAGDIDVVTIVNDGTNFLGNCAKDYS